MKENSEGESIDYNLFVFVMVEFFFIYIYLFCHCWLYRTVLRLVCLIHCEGCIAFYPVGCITQLLGRVRGEGVQLRPPRLPRVRLPEPRRSRQQDEGQVGLDEWHM